MTIIPKVMTNLFPKRLYTRIVMAFWILHRFDESVKWFFERLVMTIGTEKW